MPSKGHHDNQDGPVSTDIMEMLLSVRKAGVLSAEILSAFEAIDRAAYVDRERVYGVLHAGRAVPIACGQVQTDCVTIGRVLDALDLHKSANVLEIGTGSGYQTALIATLARQVLSVERFRTLVESARRRSQKSGLDNVRVLHADGSMGAGIEAKYDRIVINAAIHRLNRAIEDQCTNGGLIVAPILLPNCRAEITVYKKTADGLDKATIGTGHFLPMIDGIAARL